MDLSTSNANVVQGTNEETKEFKRALAYITTIDEIQPIPNYDRVEHARTRGWWVVVKKDDFKVGDKAVYFEVDSKVPDKDERFSFLESKHYKIKTQKMCKVYSQGLLMPLSEFPELDNKNINDDVTDILEVTYALEEDVKRKSNKVDPNAKYISMAARHKNIFKKKPIRWLMKRTWGKKLLFVFFGKKKDNPKGFPNWIVKTDETRCLERNTKIWTDKGIIRIADIVHKKLPVNVYSYNYETSKLELKPIVSYQEYPLADNEQMFEIEFPYKVGVGKKNRIKCTKDHKFYIGNNEYKFASELLLNDIIYMKDYCYDDNIMEIIYGMLLGDSSVSFDKKSNCNLRVTTSQGEKQLDYLKFKMNFFGDENYKIHKGKSGYCDNIVYLSHIVADHNISRLIIEDGVYNNGKHITQAMIDKLTPISLALWYLDDGNLKHKSDEDPNSPNIIISTCGFTKEENEMLINCLKNKFGVECNLRQEKNKYWSIYITTKGTIRFMELISMYIPKSMKYKIIKEYENDKCILEDVTYNRDYRLLPTKVTNITSCNYKKTNLGQKHVYDLEILDNHNFFANNILTHNCENAPFYLDSNDKWIKTEKVDGTSCTYAVDRLKKGKNKFDFIVCSRNVRQVDVDQECFHDSNIYWELAFKYNIKDILTKFAIDNNYDRVVLQGEGIGSVQGNPYQFKENDLYVFNLIINGERLGTLDMADFCDKYGLRHVPIIDKAYEIPHTMEEMKLEADGYSVLNPKVKREGFVYRSQDGKLSFKNVSREYLLKHSG